MTMRAATPLSGIRVLVVDDVEDIRDLLSLLLRKFGATVQTATSAIEALRLFSETPPDVLISDIMMPEMDGYDLIRAIRSQEYREAANATPAISISAYSDTAHKSLAAGFQAHLSKPVNQQRLVSTVSQLAELGCEAVKHSALPNENWTVGKRKDQDFIHDSETI